MKVDFLTHQTSVSFQGYSNFRDKLKSFFLGSSKNTSNPITITPPEPPVDTFELNTQNNAVQKVTIPQNSIKPFTSIVEKSWDLPEEISFHEYEMLESYINSNADARYLFRNRISRFSTDQRLLVHKLLMNNDVFQNDLIKKYGKNLIQSCELKTQVKYANAILSNKELYCNENVMKNAEEIISRLRNGVNDSIYDRVLSTPDLYNNKLVMNKLSDILMTVHSKEAAEIVHKVLSNEKLYNTERILSTSYRKMYSANPKIQEEKNVKIQFLDKYLSSDLLYKNDSITKDINIIISSLNTQKTADNIYTILDKFIANPELHNNENISNRLANIIHTIIDKDGSEKFINKIFSNKKLYNNRYLTENLSVLLNTVATTENPNILHSMLDKITGNPVLYDNISIQKSLYGILRSSTSSDIEKLKTKIINKFSNSKLLQNNKNVSDSIGNFITAIGNPHQYKIVEKILDNKNLYNNSNVMNNIYSLIYEISNPKLFEITSKILDNETLCNNEQFMKNLLRIYKNINSNSLERVQAAKYSVFEHIISNEHLYSNKSITDITEQITRKISNAEQANFVNKVLDCDKLNSNKTFLGNLTNMCGDLESFLDSFQEKSKLYSVFIDEISNNDAIQLEKKSINIEQIMKNSKTLNEFSSRILSQIKHCI